MFNVATDFEGVIPHQQQKKPTKQRDVLALLRCISLPHKNKPREGNHTTCVQFYSVYFYANQAVAGKFVVNAKTD